MDLRVTQGKNISTAAAYTRVTIHMWTTIEAVIARTTKELIITRIAEELIIASVAVYFVIAFTAVSRVVAVVAIHFVIETDPYGQKKVLITFPKGVDYPLIPLVRLLRERILEMHSNGHLY